MASELIRASINTYKKLESDIRIIKAKQNAITEEMRALCPENIGDVSTVKNMESAQPGQFQVEDIVFKVGYKSWRVGMRDESTGWLLSGRVIRKDGSVGSRRRWSFIHWNEEDR